MSFQILNDTKHLALSVSVLARKEQKKNVTLKKLQLPTDNIRESKWDYVSNLLNLLLRR